MCRVRMILHPGAHSHLSRGGRRNAPCRPSRSGMLTAALYAALVAGGSSSAAPVPEPYSDQVGITEAHYRKLVIALKNGNYEDFIGYWQPLSEGQRHVIMTQVGHKGKDLLMHASSVGPLAWNRQLLKEDDPRVVQEICPYADVNRTDERGQTALLQSLGVIAMNLKIAAALLRCGADPNRGFVKGPGTNPMMMIAYYGDESLFHLAMRSGGNLNNHDAQGNTVLGYAYKGQSGDGNIAREKAHAEIIEFIRNRGFERINVLYRERIFEEVVNRDYKISYNPEIVENRLVSTQVFDIQLNPGFLLQLKEQAAQEGLRTCYRSGYPDCRVLGDVKIEVADIETSSRLGEGYVTTGKRVQIRTKVLGKE